MSAKIASTSNLPVVVSSNVVPEVSSSLSSSKPSLSTSAMTASTKGIKNGLPVVVSSKILSNSVSDSTASIGNFSALSFSLLIS